MRAQIAPVVVAALVRLPLLWLALHATGARWAWGGEMASVAGALVAGRGFSDPYWAETGPTAHVPPLYPLLLAGLLAMTGNPDLAALLALILNVLWSALICLPLARLGDHLKPGLGQWAAWGWALWPLLSGYSEVVYPWSSSLYALVLTTLLALLLARPFRAVLVGLLAGSSLLLDPAHLPVLGVIVLGMLVSRHLTVRQVAVFSAAVVVVVLPWLVRNDLALGGPTYLRSNAGQELYRGIALHPRDQAGVARLNPGRNPDELHLYIELGERAYMRERMEQAIALMAADWTLAPRQAALHTWLYWTGNDEIEWRSLVGAHLSHLLFALPAVLAVAGLVVTRTHRVAWWVALAVLVVYPLPYALTLTLPRYRAPIDPILVVLATASVTVWGVPAHAPLGRLFGGSLWFRRA